MMNDSHPTLKKNHTDNTLLLRALIQEPAGPMPLAAAAHAAGLSPHEAEAACRALTESGVIQRGPENTLRVNADRSLLHPDLVAACLDMRWWGHSVYIADEIDSTITVARELSASPQAHGIVIAAERQSAGRGRQGAAWQSPYGKDLLLTFLIRLRDWNPADSFLSLYSALAVVHTLNESESLSLGLKWPNDIMHNGKKLGGVLIERLPDLNLASISLGLNVNSQSCDWPPALREHAASLKLIAARNWDRNRLLARLGAGWEALWETSALDMGETALGYWQRYSTIAGRDVSLICRGRPRIGLVEGIDEEGRLLLRGANGEVEKLPVEAVQELRTLKCRN